LRDGNQGAQQFRYVITSDAGHSGRMELTLIAGVIIRVVAIQYIIRQPSSAATKPLTVRASRVPSIIPQKTIPTILPRFWEGATCEANGRIKCWTIEAVPRTKLAIARQAKFGANATAAAATAANAQAATIRLRRSNMSPERNQQNHAENKTDQCKSWNVPRRVSDAEGLSHLPKQRLAVINVGDTHSRRQCHRQDSDSINLVKVWAFSVRLI
jgi:hypothetical protein